MKITVTLDEVKWIVERYLIKERGVPVSANSGEVTSHFEGKYEDQRQVVDGISFEVL
jgi:hypothetical protein